jgi:hypothetical protein
MKVKQLIKLLKDLDPDLQVILQRDLEGNGYSPLSGVDDEDVLYGEDDDGGMAMSTQDLAEDIENGYLSEDHEFVPCVILFPER